MNRRNKGFTPLEKPLSSLAGFTLVELQVASTIALITLSAVIALYLFSWRSFTIGNALLDVYSNSRNASGWLMRDIRCAAQVVASYDSSVDDDGESYTTTSHSIVLMVPSVDDDGEVISGNYDYIIYELQGTNLYRIVQKDGLSSRTAGSSVIAHNCAELTFSSDGLPLSSIANLSTVNTVSIYLPINKFTTSLSGAGTQTASISPTTVVRLRNK